MISNIEIENYKSVHDLKLELGQFNVLIGENGCGKSNILEAIGIGAAAAGGKLDNEFLTSRGIRVTEPTLMRSAFEPDTASKDIQLSFWDEQVRLVYNLSNDNQPYSKWIKSVQSEVVPAEYQTQSTKLIEGFLLEGTIAGENDMSENPIPGKIRDWTKNLPADLQEQFIQLVYDRVTERKILKQSLKGIDDFILYSPENTALRTFALEDQIQPLGIHGEGLFKLLNVFGQEPEQPKLRKLNELLGLIDWFEGFTIPEDLAVSQRQLSIQDRFITAQPTHIDQRSANEGFLFLLFYFSLFISDDTPTFFAIDNVDASLNPKLCSELTKILVQLSKEHNKRVIVTTHNPAVLDGLNLDDPDQRLLVAYRNLLGHTKVNRIQSPKPVEGQPPVRLSEAFIRGYLGGLPGNF